MVEIVVYSAFSISSVALYIALTRKVFAVCQQCGYRVSEFLPCLRTSLKNEIEKSAMCTAFGFIFALATVATGNSIVIAVLCSFFTGFTVAVTLSCENVKVKVKITARYARLRVVAFGLWFSFVAAVTVILRALTGLESVFIIYPILYASVALLPLTPVAAVVCLPYDRIKYAYYVGKAKKILSARTDLIKIAVTGSCGKTTVKKYLAELLSLKYETLATPKSYNTPLGICLSLKNLSSNTQVFIAEMGARKTGDIKELCDIVKPDIAVVTGVTEQHMETFGSLSNIIKEKGEVVNALSEKGFAVISADTAGSLKIYDSACCEKMLAGVGERAKLRAEDIKTTGDGTEFSVTVKNKRYDVSAGFFGKHNVTDFLLAFAVAQKLGVSVEKMLALAKRIRPPDHRFSVTRSADGVTIIDDGYNANIDGIKSGIECLADFEGRKIVVTAGIVEGGNESLRLNAEAGRIIAGVADFIIAVGAYKDEIAAGVGEKSGLYRVDDLDEAKKILKRVVTRGDNVLFINDLPDRY